MIFTIVQRIRPFTNWSNVMLVMLIGTLLGLIVAALANNPRLRNRTRSAKTNTHRAIRALAHYPAMGILGTCLGVLNAYFVGLAIERDIHTTTELSLRERYAVAPQTVPFVMQEPRSRVSNIDVYQFCYSKSFGVIRCETFLHAPPTKIVVLGFGTEPISYTHKWSRSPKMQLFTFDVVPVLVVEETWFGRQLFSSEPLT